MQWLTILKDLLPLEAVMRHAAKALATILIAWLVFALLRRALSTAARAAERRLDKEAQRQRFLTLVGLLASIVKYVVIFFAAIMVLRDLGVDPTPVLAGAGIVGLAVGFGAQNLVRDVVSGFFIIMEAQYAVGDLVEINGVLGRIEEVGLRVTKLRDPSGLLHYFANGSITTANNYTAEHIAYTITVPLPGEQPTDPLPLVRAILEDFDREFAVFAAPPTLALDHLPTYARVVRVTARALPGRHAALEQKLPARLASALERAGHPLPAGADVSISLFSAPGACPEQCRRASPR